MEKINRATVERLSQQRHLKKLILHGCGNNEALQDFYNCPNCWLSRATSRDLRFSVFTKIRNKIQKIQVMLGCDEPGMMDESSTSDASLKIGITAMAKRNSPFGMAFRRLRNTR